MNAGVPAHPDSSSRSSPLERFAAVATDWTGRTSAFSAAAILIAAWLASGPLFHYSDTWQLVINTLTNLITFLMVFLIQRAQTKDTLALQLKVNELIAAQHGAHNSLIAIEQLSEEQLRALRERFVLLSQVSEGVLATSVAQLHDDPLAAEPAPRHVPPPGPSEGTLRSAPHVAVTQEEPDIER